MTEKRPKPKCCAITRVSDFRRHECSNNAKVERNGKWYCGAHDPVVRAERQAKRDAVDDARHERKRARWRMNVAAPGLLAALEDAVGTAELGSCADGTQVTRWRAAIAKAEGADR